MLERNRSPVQVIAILAPPHAALALGLLMAGLGLARAASAQGEPTRQAQAGTPASVGQTTEEAVRPSDGSMAPAPTPTVPGAQQPAAGVAPSPEPSAVRDYDVDGARAIRDGRYGDAIGIYSAAVSVHPNEARFHYLLGQARVLARDPQHAIRELREAARLNPSNAEYNAELGNAYFAIGAKQAAASAYRAALRLRADHSSATARLWMSRARPAQYEGFVLNNPLPRGRSGGGAVRATRTPFTAIAGLLVVVGQAILMAAAH